MAGDNSYLHDKTLSFIRRLVQDAAAGLREACECLYQVLKRGPEIKEKLTEAFDVNWEDEDTWANVTGIPCTKEERDQAEEIFPDIISRCREVTRLYEDIEDGLDQPFCPFAITDAEEEVLKESMRGHLDDSLAHALFSDLWYRMLLDTAGKQCFLQRYQRQVQEFKNFEVCDELQVSYLQLKCRSNPELVESYKAMYYSEFDRLEMNNKFVKEGKKKFEHLLDPNYQTEMKVDRDVADLGKLAKRLNVGNGIEDWVDYVKRIVTSTLVEDRQAEYAHLAENETQIFKQLLLRFMDLKLDEKAQEEKTQVERVVEKPTTEATIDAASADKEKLLDQAEMAEELLCKVGDFFEKKLEFEKKDKDPVTAGALVARGDFLQKSIYKYLENVGVVRPRYPNTRELVDKIKQGCRDLENKVEKIAVIIVQLNDLIHTKRKEVDRCQDQKLRSLPTAPLPVWDGDLVNYLSWREEIAKLAIHPDPSQRANAIKSRVKLPEAKVLLYAAKTDTEIYEILDKTYGNKSQLCPLLIKNCYKLPNKPTEILQETQNIVKIQDLKRQLEYVRMSHELSCTVIQNLERKIQHHNFLDWKKAAELQNLNEEGKEKEKIEEFFKFLEQIRRVNATLTPYNTPSKRDDGEASRRDRGHAGRGGGGGTNPGRGAGRGGGSSRQEGGAGNDKKRLPGSRQDRTGTDGDGGRAVKCGLCEKDNGHFTHQCFLLKPENLDIENIRCALKKRNLCCRCLRFNGENHQDFCKFKYTYFLNGEKRNGCSDCRRCFEEKNRKIHHKVCEHALEKAREVQRETAKTGNRKTGAKKGEIPKKEEQKEEYDEEDDFEHETTMSQKQSIKVSGFRQNLVNGEILGSTLCPAEEVQVRRKDGQGIEVILLYDSCGQNTSIHQVFAEEMRLSSKKLPHTLVTSVGEKGQPEGRLFKIPLRGKDGDEWVAIEGLGAPALGENYNEISVPIAPEFSEKYPEILQQTGGLNRPQGKMLLLLGEDQLSIFPTEIMESKCGRQRLLKSRLTGRYLVQGKPDILGDRVKSYHEDVVPLQEFYEEGDDEDYLENYEEFEEKIQRSMVITEGCDLATRIEKRTYKLAEDILQDYDYSNLPHLTPAKCDSCKHCEKCRQNAELKSHDDYLMEQQMRKNLHYDKENKQFVATIPHDPVIEEIGDNYNNAVQALRSMKRRILKEKDGKEKLAQLDNVVKEGVAEDVFVPEEKAAKKYPKLRGQKKHHLVFSHVYNPNSESTPTRLVCDSSRPDKKGQPSYNDTIPKGHHSINKIAKCIYVFCESGTISCGDIKRMYWGTGINPENYSKRCVLWPKDGIENWSGDAEDLVTYILVRLTFGDKISSAMCNLTKELCLELFIPDREVEKDLIENSYVDDLQATQIEHGLVGKLREKTKMVDEALAMGSMEVKKWVYSGEFENGKALPEQKQLGFTWKPTEDLIKIKAVFNFSQKNRGARMSAELNPKSLLEWVKKRGVTQRNLVAGCKSIYDVTGRFTALEQNLKFVWRTHILEKGQCANWDITCSEKVTKLFVSAVLEAMKIKEFWFPRCFIPPKWRKEKRPWMCGFSDHGKGGTTYLIFYRFELENGEYHVSLVWGRGKVANLKNYTVPRGECVGIWLLCRAMNKLAKLSRIEFEKYLVFCDSQTVLSMLRTPSIFLDPFFGPKIRECMESPDSIPINYHYVKSENNVADFGTKEEIVTFEQVTSSFYQEGCFLKHPVEKWSEFCGNFIPVGPRTLPGLQKRYLALLADDPYLLDRHARGEERVGANNLEKVTPKSSTRKVAWRDAVKKYKNLDGKFRGEPFASLLMRRRNMDDGLRVLSRIRRLVRPREDLDMSMRKIEKLLVQQAMLGTRFYLRKSKIHLESVWDEEEQVLLLVSRDMGAQGPRKTIILSGRTAAGLSVLVRVHDRNHLRSTNKILNELRKTYHVPHARKYLEAIERRCLTCRRLKAIYLQRPMGRVHEEHLRGESWRGAFSVVQADIAGNWYSYDARTRRETLKLYIVTFVCCFTKCVHIEVITDLSTDGLLGAISRLSALRGEVFVCYADRGKNFLGGSNRETLEEDEEENEDVYKSDFTNVLINERTLPELNKRGSSFRLTFRLGVAEAHWRQGLCERSIRSIREQYKILRIPRRYFSLLEYIELFYRICAILNNRPIGVNVVTGDVCSPAQQLFGNRQDWYRLAVYGDKLTQRNTIVQNCLDKWRNSFQAMNREFLLRQVKWRHTAGRNLKIGDVCMILDKEMKKLSHSFVLGEVIEATKDRDEIVRKVKLAYRVPKINAEAICERDVASLSLILSAEERAQGCGYVADILGDFDDYEDDDDNEDEHNEDDDDNEDEHNEDNDDDAGEDVDIDDGEESQDQQEKDDDDVEEDENAGDDDVDVKSQESEGEKNLENPFEKLKKWENEQRRKALEEGKRLRKQ